MKVFVSLAVAGLLLLPAAAQADVVTFGSDLQGTPSLEDNHQADVLYFNQEGQKNTTQSPVDGEIVAVRIKGTILPRRSGAATKEIDRLFHIQTLKPNGNGNYTVLTSSNNYYFPFDVDPNTVSEYKSASPQCVSAGDIVDFNDIGGWQGNPGDPDGTRYQIFQRSPGNNVLWFSGDAKTNIGQSFTAEPPMREQEIMMQVVVATGYDAATNCPGGKKGQEFAGVTVTTPDPAPKVYDDGVARARVMCPENTFKGCNGSVALTVAGKPAGSANFDLQNSQSTNVKVQLPNDVAAIVAQQGSVDAVAAATSTDGYGVSKQTTGSVKLISARAPSGGMAFAGITGKAQSVTFRNRKTKTLTIKATCPAGTAVACSGKFTIKSLKRLKLKRSEKKGKVYSLGSGKFNITPGKTVKLTFKVPRSGLKALKALKKIQGIATFNAADGAGHSSSKRVKILFKYKK
jgi:hypothetical protein